MRISEAWLREWVNPSVPVAEMAKAMTMAGLTIDGTLPVTRLPALVVVAKIVSVAPHPNADKLRVCQVDAGDAVHQIVCGAANAREGLVAPLAKIGATLPGGVVIKSAELRGVASAGMLCSAKELGISEDGSGLLELAEGTNLGTELGALLPRVDHEFDVNLTPNRGDCLSARGIARELGAIFKMPVNEPQITTVAPSHSRQFPVRIDAPAACPRYIGRVLSGLNRRAPTPLWMRERLRLSGMRCIDAVVDVTNYVMLELGQPLHAFDLAQLKDGIVVRLAGAEESIKLLDGKTLQLRGDTLVIADGQGPVALAGIMGGDRSGIQADQAICDVFLECALFTPSAIRGRPRSYGLHTESSQRYERGVDSELQSLAMERATSLLLAICGGAAGPSSDTDHRHVLPPRPEIRLRADRLRRLVGTPIADLEVMDCLKRLGLAVLSQQEGDGETVWKVRSPSHRYDLDREEDLVEEVCRIYGYDRLPSLVPDAPLSINNEDSGQPQMMRIRQTMANQGFQEAITYSFIDPQTQALLQPQRQAMVLDNPLSSDMSVMRTSLIPGLLRALEYNLNRQQGRVRLFESGRCFVADAGQLAQPLRLGAVMCGGRKPENWAFSANERIEADFFDIKGVVESLLGDGLRIEPSSSSLLHPGQAASIKRDQKEVGFFGRLHPALAKALDLPAGILLLELELDDLLTAATIRYQPFSTFPAVRRDLALLLPREVSYGAVEKAVRDCVGEVLVDLKLFDLYMGEGIDSTKKSLALGLTLQDRTRTLTDAESTNWVQQVLVALQREFGAVQR